MEINYDKLNENLANESVVAEFEDFINSLTAVKYSLGKNEHGEYTQVATYYMWTGYCMAKAV
jgi:hypothetical protein